MKDLNKLLAEWVEIETDVPSYMDWNPTQSHDQIHRYLLPKVEEMGLKLEFLQALMDILYTGKTKKLMHPKIEIFEMLIATPSQICQAIAQAAGLMKEGE